MVHGRERDCRTCWDQISEGILESVEEIPKELQPLPGKMPCICL